MTILHPVLEGLEAFVKPGIMIYCSTDNKRITPFSVRKIVDNSVDEALSGLWNELLLPCIKT